MKRVDLIRHLQQHWLPPPEGRRPALHLGESGERQGLRSPAPQRNLGLSCAFAFVVIFRFRARNGSVTQFQKVTGSQLREMLLMIGDEVPFALLDHRVAFGFEAGFEGGDAAGVLGVEFAAGL